MKILKGKFCDWELVVGVEVHAQIVSKSKLFSEASTEYGAAPNSQVNLFDVAMPGILPVLNKECIYQALISGLALGCTINNVSVFDRKSYFYPDLPQGYQITQFYHPLAVDGYIDLSESAKKRVRINRIHVEQDAGKSMHISGKTYIDLNRVGVGLMEIVSEPDMTSVEEVSEFLQKLRGILRCVGSCEGDMEKGSFRCDANVSVRKVGTTELGTRCEIKNLNSIKFIRRAIMIEAQRQIDLIEEWQKVIQSTMCFDPDSDTVFATRTKEEASEYRYFPDPDLLPVVLTDDCINSARLSLPELPDKKKERYISKFGLSFDDAAILSSENNVALYFEEVVAVHNPNICANWISVELFGLLNRNGLSISKSKVTPTMMIDLLDNIVGGVISGKMAKDIFQLMFEKGESASDIIKRTGMRQITDKKEILRFIDEVLASNPKMVEDYVAGKKKLYGFFVGRVMKLTDGCANPEFVNELLLMKLNEISGDI